MRAMGRPHEHDADLEQARNAKVETLSRLAKQPTSVLECRQIELSKAHRVCQDVDFDISSASYGESHHRNWSAIREARDNSRCAIHERYSGGLGKLREGKGSFGHGTSPSSNSQGALVTS